MYCYFKFINMNSSLFIFILMPFPSMLLYLALCCAVLCYAFEQTEFTPFNYFNQILYHFNVETLIMLLKEKMLYGWIRVCLLSGAWGVMVFILQRKRIIFKTFKVFLEEFFVHRCCRFFRCWLVNYTKILLLTERHKA